MTISIVICTRNRAESLLATLTTMLPFVEHNADLKNVIVVDNGSTDKTLEYVNEIIQNHSKLIVVECKTPGLSNARNCAIKNTDSDIIVWTDDDVQVDKSWLSNLTKPIITGEADATVGRIELAQHLVKSWMTEKHRARLAENISPSNIELVGANMATKRDHLVSIGGFDEKLGAGALGFQEETLASCLLKEKGARILYVDNAIVIHHFDVARLNIKLWRKSAISLGRSCAYVSYHRGQKIPSLIAIRIIIKAIELTLHKIIHVNSHKKYPLGHDAIIGALQHLAYLKEFKNLKNTKRLHSNY